MGRFLLHLHCIVLLLSGCATLPEPLRQVPAERVSLAQLQENPERFRGRSVLLGGELLRVEVTPERSWAEVLAYPLRADGRPDVDEPPQGRFWFWTEALLDPEVYRKGREITVAGAVEGKRETVIGKRQIEIPVVRAERYYLWPPRREPEVIYLYPPPPGYWYWSWYSPWWPCWPYPCW